MTTLRGEAQARVMAISERDLLVGRSDRAKPIKATDGSAIPEGSAYLERDQATNTVAEYIRANGEWVFSRRYGAESMVEALLAEQLSLLRRLVEITEEYTEQALA